MKNIRVSLEYSRTFNMGNYSNVKPSIQISADVDSIDGLQAAIEELDIAATDYVHGKIDEALEQEGSPPEFYDGPRYKVIYARDDKLAAILPNETPIPDGWMLKCHGHRFAVAIERLLEFGEQWTLYRDRADLPELVQLSIFRRDQYIVVIPGETYISDSPEPWCRWDTSMSHVYRLRDNLLAELEAEVEKAAGEKTLVVIDDGDLSKLPPLPVDEPEPDEGDDKTIF